MALIDPNEPAGLRCDELLGRIPIPHGVRHEFEDTLPNLGIDLRSGSEGSPH